MVFDEDRVLDRLHLDYDVPEPGCCGMAGSFGFEHDMFEVAMRCVERALLPADWRAGDETIVVAADGFSCAEQITRATGRRCVQLADVLVMASNQQSNQSRRLT
jgi:hypothetical protein